MQHILAAVAVCLVTPAMAQYSTYDIDHIIEASRNNVPKFNRDYKGKTFTSFGYFESSRERLLFSGNIITVTFGHEKKPFMPEAHCSDHDVANDVIADWSTNTRLQISGTIDNTVMGSIRLTNCKITVVNREMEGELVASPAAIASARNLWQTQLSEWVARHKNYPQSAREQGQQGPPRVGFAPAAGPRGVGDDPAG